ncbi:JmjC domain-containing histone demethylation protein 1 [Trichostrongylus colubriformis]|uniref:JmjC domain-containing histone demethylation protein 1 n=1 Tax=Trichostrongylus colubriformis TaxID=6319 RepID=A0AAN8F8Y5_TRICO
MPPKKKSRGATTAARGEGRTTRSSARKAKSDHTESEGTASSDEEKSFDKGRVMSVMRYDFEDLLTNDRFEHPDLISKIDPKDFNIDYYEKSRLATPLLFECDPHELGMKVPKAEEFSVDDVLRLVGGNRMIEVVEVSGQTSVKMSLRDFVDYYKTPKEERQTLYNVLSLEFSNTEMEDIIQSPTLVRQIDWVENHWPDALRQRYITFNKKGHYTPHHTYPKVQNYCLMSVERCYTDFHVDFGGTSVWYHVLKGQKIFWLIEPSLTNIRLYEEFVKNPEQTGFFGHVVDECARVVLNPGSTAVIPSGWIHAVYTPSDSLVFGGNFLHSLRCEMQIQVYLSENRINITKKFRFPYIEELMLYVIADVVLKCTGRRYVRPARVDSARFDYVGKVWKEKGNHRKVINYQDYMSGGIQLEQKDLVAIDNQSEIQDNGVVNVIAMHAENTLLYNTAAAAAASTNQDTTVADENIEEEVTSGEEKNGEGGDKEKKDVMPHHINPYIFYHEASIFHDLYGRSTSAHRNPVGEEPPIEFKQEELDRISHLLLPEYERLCEYLRKKRLLDVEMKLIEPIPPKEAKPRRSYKRQSQGTPRTPRANKSRQGGSTRESLGDAGDETEDHFNTEDEANINDVANDTGGTEVKMENDAGEEGSFIEKHENMEDVEQKEEMEEDADDESVSKPSTSRKRQADGDYDLETEGLPEPDEDDDEDYEEKPKRRSGKAEKKKKEKPDKKAKEPKEKKTPKRRTSLSFEDALGGTPKSVKKKHDPKKDKPMFVGGLPMAPIQDGPVVPNAYNYDPMAEIMKLGTGQLQSAYRKSKLNITPPKDKKIYKLEPKHHDEEEAAKNSIEKSSKPEPPRPPVIAPLSVNIRRHSEGGPARPSPGSGPSPRTGFMPRLDDIPPTSTSGPAKTPLISPAPRKAHVSSADAAQRTPVEVSPAGSRASRGSFSEFGASSMAQVSPLSRNGSANTTPQQHPSPVPLFNPTVLCINKLENPRDEGPRPMNKPQEVRKARFADNPVSDISPPPVSTTPPFMTSPAPLHSPDLPPVFTPSSTTAQPTTSLMSAGSADLYRKLTLVEELERQARFLNKCQDKFVYKKPEGIALYFREPTATAKIENKS